MHQAVKRAFKTITLGLVLALSGLVLYRACLPKPQIGKDDAIVASSKRPAAMEKRAASLAASPAESSTLSTQANEVQASKEGSAINGSPGSENQMILEDSVVLNGTKMRPRAKAIHVENQTRAVLISEITRDVTLKDDDLINENKNLEANVVVRRLFKAGNEALRAKNYDEAIKQYDEALAADPEQPAVLTNKALAIKGRGEYLYSAAQAAQDASVKLSTINTAKTNFSAAAEVAGKAVELVRAERVPTDRLGRTRHSANELAALKIRAESIRLVVINGDPSQLNAARAAYKEYIAAATYGSEQLQAQRDLAQMLVDANALSEGREEYERMVAANPYDANLLLNLGMVLLKLGAIKESEGKKDEARVKYQEAANYLQRFVDQTSDANKNRVDARTALNDLQIRQNVVPVRKAITAGVP